MSQRLYRSHQNFDNSKTWLARIMFAAVIICVSSPSADCQTPAEASPAAAVINLESVNSAFGDLKFLFELVGSRNEYQTLQETMDLLVTGVNPSQLCQIQTFVTSSKLERLILLPVASDGDFRDFLRNLWDADMRSAPAPEKKMNSEIPEATRKKLRSLNLPSNERLMFDLWDGFARWDEGYARLSQDHTIVRKSVRPRTATSDSTLSIHIDGSAALEEARHGAFGNFKSEQLAKLKRRKSENKTEFEMRTSLTKVRLALQEIVFAESTDAKFQMGLEHSAKRAVLAGTISPMPGSSLANAVDRQQNSINRFRQIPSGQTVAAGSLNLPVSGNMLADWKSLAQSVKANALAKLEAAQGLTESAKADDQGFAEFICDLSEAAAAEPVSNAFVQIWKNESGSLVSVWGVAIEDTKRFLTRLQKLASNRQVTLSEIPDDISVYQVHVSHWLHEYPDFFDSQGSVLIACGKDTIWIGFGENAADRLKGVFKEQTTSTAVSADVAVEVSANMLPFAKIWKRIHDRRSTTAPAESRASFEDKKGSIIPLGGLASFVEGMDLASMAAAAYQEGDANLAASVKLIDGKYIIKAQAEEGTLRLAGLALTQFVKENIGD